MGFITVVKANGLEPRIPNKIVEVESRYPIVTVRVPGRFEVTADRLRRPLGSVRFVDDFGNCVAFLVRELGWLVVEPTLPEDLVKQIASFAERFAVARRSFVEIAHKLLVLASAITAAAGIEGFTATPEKVEICGVTLAPENLLEVLGNDSDREKIEQCLERAVRKIFGAEALRVGGVTV